MKTVQFLGEDCIFFFHGFQEHKNTRPAKQTNKHAQRTVDRNRHNHPFLWFDSEPFRRTILNRAQHSQTTASPELKSGFGRTLLKCRKEIWVPHAFWPAGAQRKTLVREGRNLCAINCLSLKSHLISTAECLSTRYRDNKGMKRPGWYGWNSEFKSFKE